MDNRCTTCVPEELFVLGAEGDGGRVALLGLLPFPLLALGRGRFDQLAQLAVSGTPRVRAPRPRAPGGGQALILLGLGLRLLLGALLSLLVVLLLLLLLLSLGLGCIGGRGGRGGFV